MTGHRRRAPRLPAALLAPLLLLGGITQPGATAVGAQEPAAALQERISARLDALDATSAVWARHLPTGRTVTIRADRPMNTLSVIKIAALVRAYQLAEAGHLDLGERREVAEADLRGGSGLLRTFQPGLRPTFADLLEQMIITSDNTATDLVLEEVPVEDINHMLDSLGYSETRFRTSTGELFRDLTATFERGQRDQGEAFDASAATFAFEGDSTAWLGRTTARETGRFLQELEEGRLAGAAATRAMHETLARQFYRSRLPRFLGDEVLVEHKTGDWPPHAGNDVGILRYDGGPVVVSAFVTQSRGDFLEVERTLGWIAQELVRAWDGPGG